MKPVFIFSLPRSGSTLLQRNLMAHESIASTAEPWILLPQIYSLKSKGHLSEYGSLPASRAINDLIYNLPNKKKDFNDSLKNFIIDIYKKLSKNNESYFLDKTPRYYLIIPEIIEIFPEAKFIFLFRSPEQIYASMLQTWSNNKFRSFLSSYYDLIDGLKMLSLNYNKYKNQSIALKYEDLVNSPENELKRITNYLELDFDNNMINNFSNQKTMGRLGDPTGINYYNSISKESIEKWKLTFNTIIRKRIALNIIKKIDNQALETQGYIKVDILKSIKSVKVVSTFSGIRDLFDYFVDCLIRRLNLHLFFSKDFKWSRKKYIS